MKKIFLIALAFAAFSGVKAQNEGFSIAPKIGMNVSKVSDMSFSDVKAKSLADFNIGLTGQYRFENSFALETGIIYSRQGVKYKTRLHQRSRAGEILYSKGPERVCRAGIRFLRFKKIQLR